MCYKDSEQGQMFLYLLLEALSVEIRETYKKMIIWDKDVGHAQMYNIEESQSIFHHSVIITSYKTDSRPKGQESEEKKYNLFIILICLFYVSL